MTQNRKRTQKRPALRVGAAITVGLLALACSQTQPPAPVQKPAPTAQQTTAKAPQATTPAPPSAAAPQPSVAAAQPRTEGVTPGGQRARLPVLEKFDSSGPAAYQAQPGEVLVFTNTGIQNWGITSPEEQNTNTKPRVVVINARTKEVLADAQFTFPAKASPRASPHTIGMSPDARWIYLGGSYGDELGFLMVINAQTLKVDRILDLGAQLHHAQVYQDRYLLMDTFSTRGTTTKDVFLFDPATDEVVGGIGAGQLSGRPYTAFGGPDGFIYVNMEPKDAKAGPGWLSKVDPASWKEIATVTHGRRSNWVAFSPDGRFIFTDSAHDFAANKIDAKEMKLVGTGRTGPGPYGLRLSADGKKLYVADKGEMNDHMGISLTVLDAAKMSWLKTIPVARGVDHLTLSPDGREIWATSNDAGTIYVVDTTADRVTGTVVLPQRGDPHGVIFVQYDQQGRGQVVSDIGGLHSGAERILAPVRGTAPAVKEEAVTQDIAAALADSAFEPAKISVKAGSTVRLTLTNKGQLAHNFVSSEPTLPDANLLNPGQTQKLLWAVPNHTGSFQAVCSFHPGMEVDISIE